MKLVARLTSLVVLAAAAVFLLNCGSDGGETKSAEQTQLEALSKVWTLTSAKQEGDERKDDFANLKLTLSGAFQAGGVYAYSFTGTTPTPSPIPRSGTWKFGSTVTTQIIRDPETDSFPIGYTLSGNTLTLTFDCAECNYAGGGRVNTVNGQWVMVFTGS